MKTTCHCSRIFSRPALSLFSAMTLCALVLPFLSTQAALAADATAGGAPAAPPAVPGTTAPVPPALAPVAPPAVAKTMATMLGAVSDADYVTFIGSAKFEPAFMAVMDKAAFKQLSDQFSAHLKKGYATTYLGELHVKGYEVSMFKLSFTDAADDVLITLSIKDGSVGGLYFS